MDTDLDTGAVVSVESPHSSAAGASCSHGRGCLASSSTSCLPLSHLDTNKRSVKVGMLDVQLLCNECKVGHKFSQNQEKAYAYEYEV